MKTSSASTRRRWLAGKTQHTKSQSVDVWRSFFSSFSFDDDGNSEKPLREEKETQEEEKLLGTFPYFGIFSLSNWHESEQKCKGNTCEFNPRWCWWAVVVDVIFIIFSVKLLWCSSGELQQDLEMRIVAKSEEKLRRESSMCLNRLWSCKFCSFLWCSRLLNSPNVHELRWLELHTKSSWDISSTEHDTRSSLQCRANAWNPIQSSECVRPNRRDVHRADE